MRARASCTHSGLTMSTTLCAGAPSDCASLMWSGAQSGGHRVDIVVPGMPAKVAICPVRRKSQSLPHSLTCDLAMTDPCAPLDKPADGVGLSSQSCPQCGSRLIRISRKPLDRLLSLFAPLHRYRCPSFSCRWEGCLRVAYPSAPTAPGALSSASEDDAVPPRRSRPPP